MSRHFRNRSTPVRAAIIAAIAVLAGSATAHPRATSATNHANSNAWVIGPIIHGRSYSRGMPLAPTPRRGGGWQVELPQPPASLHAVTFRHGSLEGRKRIVMHYRIEADPGVRILPRTAPGSPSIVTLFFQRSGDDWSARGPFEAYRWYATFASQSPITPGDHVMVASLAGNWTAVERSTARTNPIAFRDAVAGADQVGLVLGGGDGFGHGVFATGRARLIVTSFRVE